MTRSSVTQAQLRRAIRAAQEAGLTITACTITPEGIARLVFADDTALDVRPLPSDNPQPKPWPRIATS